MIPRVLCLFVIICFLTISSCTKKKVEDLPCETDIDTPTINPPDCTLNYTLPAENIDLPIEIWNPSGPITRYPLRYSYSYPTFNPTNSNQIVYIRTDHESFQGVCNRELWTFDFCTGEASLLSDNACYGTDWSSKDWIVYTGTDRNLFKIKSNGDSLMQITNSIGYSNSAKWSPTGDSIIFLKIDGENNDLQLIDKNGALLSQESNFPFNFLNYQKDFILYDGYGDPFNHSNYAIWTKQINQETATNIQPIEICCSGDSVVHSAHLLNSSELVWNNGGTINLNDSKTGNRRTILSGTSNRKYRDLDVSSNEKSILFQRIDYVEIDHFILEVYNQLFISDINGGNERKIIIPD